MKNYYAHENRFDGRDNIDVYHEFESRKERDEYVANNEHATKITAKEYYKVRNYEMSCFVDFEYHISESTIKNIMSDIHKH